MASRNGHPRPYGVKFWGIGNEMWGEWQFGVMPLAQFEIKHNLFAKAMRQVDPTIQLIACGAMPDCMTGSKQAKRLTGKVIAEFGSPADWSGGLLANCLGNLDWLSEHFYCYNNRRFDLEKAITSPRTGEPLIEWQRRPANVVRAKFEHYQEYLRRIPG